MKWQEAHSLPIACQGCREEDCYNCENAAARWQLGWEDELRLRRKMLVKAIERLEKQVQAIDEALAQNSVK